MKYKANIKTAVMKLLSIALILIMLFYFVNSCSIISKRSLDSVVKTTWFSDELTLNFGATDGVVVYDKNTTINFNFIEENGYIFGFDLYSDDLILEFVNLDTRIYCSTLNTMFYSELIVYA